MNTNYKVDLHSHSIISYDGGITPEQYKQLLANGVIDYIAITDHNETKLAKQLHDKLGDKIIIGEEITTREGEIIGLFISQTIPKGLALTDAIRQIKHQGGLVYLPHPFETLRQGVQLEMAKKNNHDLDIIEIFNARGLLRGKPQQALQFAHDHQLAMAASSDAHVQFGIGTAYSLVNEVPTQKSLKALLKNASYKESNAPFFSLFFPSINKIKKQLSASRK